VTYLSIIEDDKNIAKKYLNMAFAVSLMFVLTIFIISQKRTVSNFLYLLPVVAFVFCYMLSVFYKKRGKINSVFIDDSKAEFMVDGVLSVFKLSEITKISISIIKSSQEHYFDFYLHTSDESFLVPRLESVTDIKIIKLLISLNKKINVSEIEKHI
jgi:hypothetical protein